MVLVVLLSGIGLSAINAEKAEEKVVEMKQGIYKHYKGALYQVVGVARHSETLDPVVVYQALYGEYGLWVRPLKMFLETVMVDGKEVPRFAYQSSGTTSLPAVGE